MMMMRLNGIVVAGLLLLAPATALGQGNRPGTPPGQGGTPPGGGGTATVTTVTGLGFGTLVAGLSRTIRPADAGAGRFDITAPPNSLVTLTFALPASLTTPSGATMPISFGTSAAAWSGTNNAAAATTFDPVAGTTITVPTTKTAYVWVGGTIAPPASQEGGSYSGTITLSVVLN